MACIAFTPKLTPTGRASALESVYAAAGLKVQIEAGPVGLVVYGPTPAAVLATSKSLVATAKMRDVRARIDGGVCIDAEEPEPTRWCAVVAFDWSTFDAPGVRPV